MKTQKTENTHGRIGYISTPESGSITVHAPWFSGYAPASMPIFGDDYCLVVAHDIDSPAILCVWTGNDADRQIPIGTHNIVVKNGASKTQTFRIVYNGRNDITVTEIN